MLRRVNYFVLGLLGTSLISAITVPFLAWFYSPDALGRFSFFLLTVNFAVQIGTLGLDQGYVREYHVAENKPQLLFQSVFPSVLIFAILCFALAGFSLFDDFAELVVSESVALLGVLIFLAYAFSVAHRFATVSYRVRSLGFLFCVTLISVKLVFLVCAYIAHLFQWQESFSLYGSYLVSLVVPAVVLGSVWASRSLKESSKEFSRLSLLSLIDWGLLKYSLPLLFGALAFWGVKFSGHIGLRFFQSFEELAFYSVGISIAAGLGLFSSIFNTMWFPFLFKADAAGQSDRALGVGLNLTLGFLFFGVGVSGAAAPFIVKLLPETFGKVEFFLPILVLSSLLYTLSEVSGSGIVLSKKTAYGFYAGLCASLVAISAALVLCGRFGAIGAALSYGIGYFVFFVCRTEFGRRLRSSQNVFKTYFSVGVCTVYAGLCVSPSLSGTAIPVYVGLGLAALAASLILKSSAQLKVLRKAVQ